MFDARYLLYGFQYGFKECFFFSGFQFFVSIAEGFDGLKDPSCRDTKKLNPFSQVHILEIVGYHNNVDIAVFSWSTAGIRTEKNDFLRADPQFFNFFLKTR